MTTAPINIENIPAELRDLNQWVVWREEQRDGKPTKVPYNAKTGGKAATDNPATWTTFNEAYAVYETNSQYNGIGFVFTRDDPYCGIDLDSCYDPTTNTLSSWAHEIIRDLDSYTERSVSGQGAHGILRGKLPGERHRSGNIEMYDNLRFFTMTGNHLSQLPATINDRQDQLDQLYDQTFPAIPTEQSSHSSNGKEINLPDNVLLDRALNNDQKFARLYDGDISGYPSHSEADQALCNKIVFWFGHDADRVDRIFRESGLYREKWERQDYQDRTISSAMAFTAEQYEPPESQPTLSLNGTPKEKELGFAFTRTDTANAERLVEQHGEDLKFCHPWNRWLVWTGEYWALDDTAEVQRRAKQTARTIAAEAVEMEDAKQYETHLKFAAASQSESKRRSMINLASSEEGIPVLPDHLDADPWLLTCRNGTIDLRTGQPRQHQRRDLITKYSPVEYDGAANCPIFTRFLDQITAGNTELQQFIQRSFGYSLTGDTREQVLFILHGTGSNGKSTLVELFLRLLNDYGRQTATETLMVKRHDAIPNDLAALKGSRFVGASETEEGRRLSEALVKQLTGGDRIAARFMRAEWFEFIPEFKIWMFTNHKPVIRGTDHAIWRRIRLVPFEVQIPDHEQDKTLPAKLRQELPGVLNWAIEGCLAWQRDGLGTPEKVKAATKAYREEMDVLGPWLEDCCILGKENQTTVKLLYESYTTWCEANGDKPISKTMLGKRLGERGLDRYQGPGGKRYWLGISIREN